MAPRKRNSTTKNDKPVEKSEDEQKLEQLFQQLNIRRIYPGSQKKEDNPSKHQLQNLDPLSSLTSGMMSTSTSCPPQPKPKEEHSCKVCHQQFPTLMTWFWHDLRHVAQDKFKCTICTKLEHSPKACWIHELQAHGYAAKPFLFDPTKDPEQLGEPEVTVDTSAVKKDTNSLSEDLAKTVSDAEKMCLDFQNKLPWFYGPSSEEPSPGTSKGLPVTTKTKTTADVNSLGLLISLNWLYVCVRCENCADTAEEADKHYNLCFPEKEKEFGEATIKYQKGSYGNRKCPLCPLLRYPTNSFWINHCIDKHRKYFELFKQVGDKDELLKCNSCGETFEEPLAFHHHLKKTYGKDKFQCERKPKDEDKTSGSGSGSILLNWSVGGSPLGRMEITDLMSIQTIRKQLHCPICGMKSKELGVIADCLRDHGIQICSLCFNTYCSKKDLEKHLIQCHGKGLSKRLKCPVCPKVFRNYFQACAHMYGGHWKEVLKEIEEEDKKAEEEKKKNLAQFLEVDEETCSEQTECTNEKETDEDEDWEEVEFVDGSVLSEVDCQIGK